MTSQTGTRHPQLHELTPSRAEPSKPGWRAALSARCAQTLGAISRLLVNDISTDQVIRAALPHRQALFIGRGCDTMRDHAAWLARTLSLRLLHEANPDRLPLLIEDFGQNIDLLILEREALRTAQTTLPALAGCIRGHCPDMPVILLSDLQHRPNWPAQDRPRGWALLPNPPSRTDLWFGLRSAILRAKGIAAS